MTGHGLIFLRPQPAPPGRRAGLEWHWKPAHTALAAGPGAHLPAGRGHTIVRPGDLHPGSRLRLPPRRRRHPARALRHRRSRGEPATGANRRLNRRGGSCTSPHPWPT